MLNFIFKYLYDKLVANEHLHMFGFMKPSLILQPIIVGASGNKQGVALANRFQYAPRGVLLFVPYNIK